MIRQYFWPGAGNTNCMMVYAALHVCTITITHSMYRLAHSMAIRETRQLEFIHEEHFVERKIGVENQTKTRA
jgi:hypothetical protein